MRKHPGFLDRFWTRLGPARRRRHNQARKTARRTPRMEALEERRLLSITANWTGAADNTWNTSANWDTNSVPGENDTARFPSSLPRQTIAQDATAGTTVDTIDIEADNIQIAGNPLTFNTVVVGGSVTGALISAGIAGSFVKDGAGPLEISGTNYSDGDVSVSVAAGTLAVDSAAALADGTDLNIGDTDALGPPPPPSDFFARATPRVPLSDHLPDISAANVVYVSGAGVATADDFNTGQASRTYDSTLLPSSGGLGRGWFDVNQPYAVERGSQVTIVLGAEQGLRFNDTGGGTFSGVNGIKETLSDAGGLFTFTTQDGTVYQFHDFASYNVSDARRGQFVGRFEPSGASQTVTGKDGPSHQSVRQPGP